MANTHQMEKTAENIITFDFNYNLKKQTWDKKLVSVDFNKYIDQDIDMVKKELNKIFEYSKYCVVDSTYYRRFTSSSDIVELFSVEGIVAKIQCKNNYSYPITLHSKKYILINDIASTNKITKLRLTKIIQLMTLDHIKKCFDNSTNTHNITLKDVITKRIFSDEEYAKLFKYMDAIVQQYYRENIANRVDVDAINMMEYIDMDIDQVLLSLNEKLLEKYVILDCREDMDLIGYMYAVYVSPNNKNKVDHITVVNGINPDKVFQKMVVEKNDPNQDNLNGFFGLNIENTICKIRNKYSYGVYDCRIENYIDYASQGYDNKAEFHDENGLLVHSNSSNQIKLFEYIVKDQLQTFRPSDVFCKNKNLSDVNLNKYIGMHVADVFLELKNELSEKYQIMKFINRTFDKSLFQIKLFSDENSILKVIQYKNGSDFVTTIKENKCGQDITSIDCKKFFNRNYLHVVTELLNLLDDKYILEPEDENKKYGFWIGIELKAINTFNYEPDFVYNAYSRHVCEIKYINDDNKTVIIQ